MFDLHQGADIAKKNCCMFYVDPKIYSNIEKKYFPILFLKLEGGGRNLAS